MNLSGQETSEFIRTKNSEYMRTGNNYTNLSGQETRSESNQEHTKLTKPVDIQLFA